MPTAISRPPIMRESSVTLAGMAILTRDSVKVRATNAAMPKPIRPRAMVLMAEAELEGIGLGSCLMVTLALIRGSTRDVLVVG